jgi:hypothetical protein
LILHPRRMQIVHRPTRICRYNPRRRHTVTLRLREPKCCVLLWATGRMVAICLCCRLYTLCPLKHQRTFRVYVQNPIEMFKPPPLTSARLSSAPRASTPARAWPACNRPFVQIIAYLFSLFRNCSNCCMFVMRAILMRLLRFRVGKMLRKVGQQGARVAISEFNVCNLVILPLLPPLAQQECFRHPDV